MLLDPFYGDSDVNRSAAPALKFVGNFSYKDNDVLASSFLLNAGQAALKLLDW